MRNRYITFLTMVVAAAFVVGMSVAAESRSPHAGSIYLATNVKNLRPNTTELYLGFAGRVPVRGKLVANPHDNWQDINPDLPSYQITLLTGPFFSPTVNSFKNILLAGCLEHEFFTEMSAKEARSICWDTTRTIKNWMDSSDVKLVAFLLGTDRYPGGLSLLSGEEWESFEDQPHLVISGSWEVERDPATPSSAGSPVETPGMSDPARPEITANLFKGHFSASENPDAPPSEKSPAETLDTSDFARPEIISGIYNGHFDLQQPRVFALNYTIRLLRELDARCQFVKDRNALRIADAGIYRELSNPMRILNNVNQSLGSGRRRGATAGDRTLFSEETIQSWAEHDARLMRERFGCRSGELERYVENYIRYVHRDAPVYYTGQDWEGEGRSVRDTCVNIYMARSSAGPQRRAEFCDCLVASLNDADVAAEDLVLMAKEFSRDNINRMQEKYPVFLRRAERCYR